MARQVCGGKSSFAEVSTDTIALAASRFKQGGAVNPALAAPLQARPSGLPDQEQDELVASSLRDK